MAEVKLPTFFTQDFVSLIPEQRMKLAELMQQRKIFTYTLNADRTRLWIVVAAKNETAARDVLAQLPLDKYYSYSLEQLMFHEMAGLQYPAVSLN
jgi:hypothetical protein